MEVMRQTLILVKLSPHQISQAKAVNGRRKQITHALLCGSHGQIFGTEKQCRKYFSVWNPAYKIEVLPGKFESLFPGLFDKAVETDDYEIRDFRTTLNLVYHLIEAQDRV